MKNKKNVVFLVILIITIITAIGSFTYAYFKGQTGSSAKVDVKVETGTIDNLTFDKCSPINLTVTQANFGEGAGNQEGSTCLKATLSANNTTNQASQTYNVYLELLEKAIKYNDLQNPETELLLQVTNPNGEELKTINGLSYVSQNGVSGFDITHTRGIIQIAENYEINVDNTSSNPKTDEWQLKVIMLNLDRDQSYNAGKVFRAEGIIEKENWDLLTVLLGDLNFEGLINEENREILNNHMTGSGHLKESMQLFAADMTKDDVVNFTDAQQLLAHYVEGDNEEFVYVPLTKEYLSYIPLQDY